MDEIPLPYETLFLVCTNRREDGRPACGPAGGDALRELLKRLVRERRPASMARVSSTGCLGCCAEGPTVVVLPGGVRYARVHEEDLPGILERHLPGEACMRRVIPLFALLLLAACSNQGTRPKDELVPGRITDLRVADVGDSTVTLTWTAPGDDGTTGKVEAYEVRWLNSLFTEPDWTAGTTAGPLPTPGVAGTHETAVLRGVPGGAMRYFALKSRDEAENWSIISNNDARAWLGRPACRAMPDSVDFGDVPVGLPFDLEFVLHNDGGGTLRGSVSIDCPAFALVSGGGIVALRHGAHQTVRVRFTPGAEGEARCRIEAGGSCGPVRCAGRGVPSLPMSMIAIETGVVFSMGSPRTETGRDPVDERSHPARLTRPFLAGAHEVTQAEWVAIMGWNDSAFPGGDRPVERITWFDALDFCNRMSVRDSLTAVYSIGDRSVQGNHTMQADVVPHWHNNGYRLPTEAEWEFACRAGTTGATFRGETTIPSCTPPDPALDPAGWYCGNSDGATHQVGRREGNPWGLGDVLGNVFEWTWDRYDATYGLDFPPLPAEPDSVASDPVGPSTGDSRVCRGGSWSVTPRECRSAFRFYHPPGGFYSDVGVRIVRAAP
jgi:formylglycine-generating enzyme required for sulfatase activity/(2Fe-2S) ferredoxin